LDLFLVGPVLDVAEWKLDDVLQYKYGSVLGYLSDLGHQNARLEQEAVAIMRLALLIDHVAPVVEEQAPQLVDVTPTALDAGKKPIVVRSTGHTKH